MLIADDETKPFGIIEPFYFPYWHSGPLTILNVKVTADIVQLQPNRQQTSLVNRDLTEHPFS
ncbi:hypothetical protein QWZ13_10965 [Reinekea marina]|uniref:hypothetical protein n=1 Tax=Reinekea marina TaxID=1310421 RepID=UPI0025B32DC0|nr:hypothetical protein [Reinekea marina]MDN3649433.1 hypothetical protein [Reinekea marina]